jgi:sugar lactone lactonase YvrE
VPPRTQAQTTGVAATSTPLILPSALVFDPQGNLYLAETANHLIRKVDTNGHITTIAGTGTQGFSGDGGQATTADLDSPQGLALDIAGNLYIADTHNCRIRKLNLTTGIITTIAGNTSPGFDGDNGPATSAHLNLPTALAFDTAGSLYLADTGNDRIRKVSATGTITTIAGTGTQGFSGDGGQATAATIDTPTGIAVDTTGNLYLADTHNHRIRKITTATGIITTIAGTATFGYGGDNASATSAHLALPQGITLDPSGNLYLADAANHRIRRIDATSGTITTVAGEGTENFAGDNGLAPSASLDIPHTTAISPTGLLTFADTANQRVRQIANDNTIHTIAGLGVTTPGALTVNAPAVIAYGTGILNASLATSVPASGSITFLDTYNSVTTTIGTANVTSNAATLNTSALPAGHHSIIATYTGDLIHASAQSSAFALTITPQPLTATVASSTIFYGQPIPNVTGTLTGLLLQDASTITAIYTTIATPLSPPGTYPITISLTGSAAGNYVLSTTAPVLTIKPAPTLTTLSSSVATATPGTSVNLTTHVASSTTGTPTGTVSLLDSATTLLTEAVPASGDTVFITTDLATGSHTLTTVYSGDANFSASTSSPVIIGIGTTSGTTTDSDFTLATAGAASQTVSSGASASFNFTVQMQGTPLSSPIALTVTGLPNFATASFTPTYLPPGATTNTFTLTITTPKTTALRKSPPPTLVSILFPIAGIVFRRRKLHAKLFAMTAAILTITLTGCGDRINTGAQAIAAKSYIITVTGTATSPTGTILQHAANVTLIMPAS